MKQAAKTVAELKVNELKSIIRDTFREIIDPDHGLTLRPEVEAELSKSIKSRKHISAEKVAAAMGLRW